VSRFLFLLSVTLSSFLAAPQTVAQGQDSTPAERDIQVIGALLSGLYSNANQSYFDRRLDRDTRHAGWEVRVVQGEAGAESFDLVAVALADGSAGPRFRLQLELEDDGATVVTYATLRPPRPPPGASADEPPPACKLVWRRSAAEFVAEQRDRCHSSSIRRLVLSEKQLWIEIDGMEGGDLELNRAREFQCYADIPGVGGGRDEPYDRYAGLALHDQGGSAWFTSKEGRRLGVSMLLVDWPMNNYDGAFARDSLVVYVSEETGAGRQELGYAFTVPEADRIGINLKWMLVNCFMQSNADIAPFM
jgi:hypothetical protein